MLSGNPLQLLATPQLALHLAVGFSLLSLTQQNNI
jgi:hypothetical protein